ncbi:transcriptional regulator [Lactobacillus sp. CBA3606]|uniref:helix-turn-helix transcriptional regulator n=1 Tax=Lactobacillus sp. CBA3606 TaxID=2099789 RepID=UPI000CFC3FB9|nr:helix-turn-helix transcriptional regulator [Lactobacillus sp. CBA3606]AVK64287.1 transcriptional regulator [Lactobacillus sp. CBA3606]
MAITFAHQLTKIRQQQHLSQAQLARQLTLPRSVVAQWEQGQTTPELDQLIKLAALLQVSLDDLVLGESTNRQLTTLPRLTTNGGWERLVRYWWLGLSLVGLILWALMSFSGAL